MIDRKLKVSVSSGFINKTPITSKLAYKHGFMPHEITIIDLGFAIDDGMTFSYQFIENTRSAENFKATDILAIDVDYGMTLDEALAHPIVQRYCSMMYITVNHSADHHRFRLIFVLPRTITNPRELSAATRALAQRLGGDRAATDAARMFHGNKDCNPEILGNSIDDKFLAELIGDGLTIPASESISFTGSTSNRSLFRPDAGLKVKTSDGRYVDAISIETLTPIHCPFHDDRTPSAFVSRNKKDSVYLYCPKCQKTWWLTDGQPDIVNFNEFEEVVIALTEDDLPRKRKATLMEFFENQDPIKPDNIHVTSTRHLKIRELKHGLTLIKSPKGSGKTSFLADILERVIYRYPSLEAYEENTDPDCDEPFFGKDKILLIGHRQALIGELCQRLRLNCYLDDKGLNQGDMLSRRRRYGICLDSLWKIQDQKYDIVVIDEVEQVLAHFFSDTIGEKRYGIFGIFARIICSAKKVVALDADLGWTTFITLSDLVRFDLSTVKSKKELKRYNPRKILPVHIYINRWQQRDKVVNLYPNVSQLIYRIKQDIVSNSRIFICANSKKKIKALDASLKKFEEELGRDIPRIMITSDNSTNSEVQSFIKNIATECLNYQVILSSPSLGTGIDINFENDRQEIDSVYGIFENQVNTHFEIDQQLARVRNPKEVHVWVSPVTYNFETEFEVVKNDYMRRNLHNNITTGFSPFVMSSDHEVDPFLKLAVLVISRERASKNYLKTNFINYRKSQGWEVEDVLFDDEIREEGRLFFKIGKDITKEENIVAVLNAPVLNRVEYAKIEDMLDDEDAVISPEMWASFQRTRLEVFYQEPISRELLKRDRGGKYRRAVIMFEQFSTIGDKPYQQFLDTYSRFRDNKHKKLLEKLFVDRPTQCVLIHGLLSTTPFFEKGVFDTTVVFTTKDLQKFVRASTKLKPQVDTQLKINTQQDIHLKPAQHLNKILPLIGLRHRKVKTWVENKVKMNAYRLDAGVLGEMRALVEKRDAMDGDGWKLIDQTYGFSYPDLEKVREMFHPPAKRGKRTIKTS